MTAPANFEGKVRPTNCLVWIGATNTKGYGLVSIGGGQIALAHRVAYEAEFGPIPDGHVIDHLCRVRNCVNPMHLQAVTVAENNRRGRAAERLTVGDLCINGHHIAEDGLYVRPTGATECRECIRAGRRANSAGRPRPSTQLSAARVASDLDQTDGAA
jgi:hypothetical protein